MGWGVPGRDGLAFGLETLESEALRLSDSSEPPCCWRALFDPFDPDFLDPRPPLLPLIPVVDDARTPDAFSVWVDTRPSASSR